MSDSLGDSYWMVRIDDSDACSGSRLALILSTLQEIGQFKQAVADDMELFEGRLFPALGDHHVVIEMEQLISDVHQLTQIVWGDFFLFDNLGDRSDWKAAVTFFDQIALCRCLVQAADNTYFFVVTRSRQFVDAVTKLSLDCAIVGYAPLPELPFMH